MQAMSTFIAINTMENDELDGYSLPGLNIQCRFSFSVPFLLSIPLNDEISWQKTCALGNSCFSHSPFSFP
jgi:hypothetical protein